MEANTKVIALVGRKGSGKSTLAQAICDADPRFIRASFAGPLKELACEVFLLERDAVYGPSEERERKVPGSDTRAYWERVFGRAWLLRNRLTAMFPGQSRGEVLGRLQMIFEELEALAYTVGMSHRVVLQKLGTDWGRYLDENVWVNALLWSLPEGQRAVVDDARFPNEVAAIAPYGTSWYLNAPERLGPIDPGAHASEPRLETFAGLVDGVLSTDGANSPESIAKNVLASTFCAPDESV